MKFIIANNISELRLARGMSQEKLAAEVGVTRATINAIEKENYNPSLDLAFRISVFFEQSLDETFTIVGVYE